ncbi:MAG: molybdate ABC transporter substrate-binding protein, partial [Candidatus Korobacteraceae bacterium]
MLFTALPGLAQQPITVAAASDLSFALPELARLFEHQSGAPVRTVLGSSGNLFTQIQNGAPYDVFLSADAMYPRRLADSGKAIGETYTLYAVGRLVLYVRVDSPLDVARLGKEALLAPSVRRIAIANPAHAPYGAAAVAALKSWNLYERLQPKLVFGENVSQTAQFVLSGNAQIALTAHSVAQAQEGRFALVPEEAHPPIEQAAVVVAQSKMQKAARAFVQFLATPKAQEVLRRYGFQMPKDAGSPNGDSL